MATEDSECAELLSALDSSDWSVVLQAVALAETQIRNSIVGDPKVEQIVAKLLHSRVTPNGRYEVQSQMLPPMPLTPYSKAYWPNSHWMTIEE